MAAPSGGGNVWDLGEISPASGKNKTLQRARGKEGKVHQQRRERDKPQSLGQKGAKNENTDLGK